MTNPYFAYSLKQEYNTKSDSPLPSEPIRVKKARACDACSIRKTKCDHHRPCRQCVNNNLECSELRERKKPGPRSIRRKTIDSINTLRNSSESPDNLNIQVDFGNSSLPDLTIVVQELTQYSPDWFVSCVPLTTYTMASEVRGLLPQLVDDPVIDASHSLRFYLKRYAVMTLLLILLMVSKSSDNSGRIDVLLTAVQRHVSCMSQVCNDFIFFENNLGGSDVHYYLLLAELHLFSYMQLRSPRSTQNFTRLKSASAHYQVLSAAYGETQLSLNEVRFTIFLWERHAALSHADPSYRNTSFTISSTDLPEQLAFTNFGFLEVYKELLNALDIEGVFKLGLPDLFDFEVKRGFGFSQAKFHQISGRLQQTILLHCRHTKRPSDLAICHLLELGTRFKILIMSADGASVPFLQEQTLEIVKSINMVFTGLSDDGIRPLLARFSIVTRLLEILEYQLRITGDIDLDSITLDLLIQFSGHINHYVDKCGDSWFKRPIISNWFQKLYITE